MPREPRDTARMRDPDRPPGDPDIALQNPNRYPDVRARRLRPWLERLLAALAPRAQSLGVRFCGDREMRRVNRQYRGLDKTTDVLSFPGQDGGEEDSHLGDVLISVPVARRQAAEGHHGPEREIKTLLLHGVLHCLGYDHESDDGEMERLERRLRKKWLAAEYVGGAEKRPHPRPLSQLPPPYPRERGEKQDSEALSRFFLSPLSRRGPGGSRERGGGEGPKGGHA